MDGSVSYAMVQTRKATAMPWAINPIEDSDDNLTPLPKSLPPEAPKLRRSVRTAANISIAMIIEHGRKMYLAALNAEDAEQWKKAIRNKVALIESHEVFTFVEKVPNGPSMIESHSGIGRKLMANRTIDKWKVRLVSRCNLQKPGDYNEITSPVIDSA
jgi:hypothetical protein